MMDLFHPMEVYKALELTYRQLSYWDSTGLVSPTRRNLPDGRGCRKGARRYTTDHLFALWLCTSLRPTCSVQNLRQVLPGYPTATQLGLPQVEPPALMIDRQTGHYLCVPDPRYLWGTNLLGHERWLLETREFLKILQSIRERRGRTEAPGPLCSGEAAGRPTEALGRPVE